MYTFCLPLPYLGEQAPTSQAKRPILHLFFLLGASALYAKATEKAVSAMTSATATGGVLTGACAVYYIWTINGKREERKVECNELKSRLNIYITKIENKKKDQNKNMTDYQQLMDLNM